MIKYILKTIQIFEKFRLLINVISGNHRVGQKPKFMALDVLYNITNR